MTVKNTAGAISSHARKLAPNGRFLGQIHTELGYLRLLVGLARNTCLPLLSLQRRQGTAHVRLTETDAAVAEMWSLNYPDLGR